MGFLSNKVDRSEIKAGDHIYTYRAGFAYSHHGIFIGGNAVVHFTCDLDTTSRTNIFSASSSDFKPKTPTSCMAYPDCGFRQPNSGVVLSCLDCFLGNGDPYIFQYGVTPALFLAKVRGGSCSTAMSDGPDTVIHRAMYLLNKGFGKYDVFKNNCEDFALYCKTGLLTMKRSGQAAAMSSVFAGYDVLKKNCDDFASFCKKGLLIMNKVGCGRSGEAAAVRSVLAGYDVLKNECEDFASFCKTGLLIMNKVGCGRSGQTAAVSSVLKCIVSYPLKLLIPSPGGIATVAGMYCINRYATDIGVRSDVVKVAVEDLDVKLHFI